MAEFPAFLAPDIAESIVEGRQPTSLTAEALTRHIEIPLDVIVVYKVDRQPAENF
jgi:hypothetical protein